MNQPHPVPRWLGVGLSLLMVIASSLAIAWQVRQLFTEAEADPPAAPIDEESTRGTLHRAAASNSEGVHKTAASTSAGGQ